MPLSTDVSLARSATPVFASHCIVCGEEPAGSTLRIAQRTASLLGFVTLLVGTKHAVDVPCCENCAPSLRAQHRRRAWSGLPVAVAVMLVLFPLIKDLPPPIRRPLAIGAIILLLVPQILYEVFRPLPFDMTVGRLSVDYEFADPGEVTIFHSLNEEAGAEIEL